MKLLGELSGPGSAPLSWCARAGKGGVGRCHSYPLFSESSGSPPPQTEQLTALRFLSCGRRKRQGPGGGTVCRDVEGGTSRAHGDARANLGKSKTCLPQPPPTLALRTLLNVVESKRESRQALVEFVRFWGEKEAGTWPALVAHLPATLNPKSKAGTDPVSPPRSRTGTSTA